MGFLFLIGKTNDSAVTKRHDTDMIVESIKILLQNYHFLQHCFGTKIGIQ